MGPLEPFGPSGIDERGSILEAYSFFTIIAEGNPLYEVSRSLGHPEHSGSRFLILNSQADFEYTPESLSRFRATFTGRIHR